MGSVDGTERRNRGLTALLQLWVAVVTMKLPMAELGTLHLIAPQLFWAKLIQSPIVYLSLTGTDIQKIS